MFGKILNSHHEIVAEGECDIDRIKGTVSMRPLYDMPLLERQHGVLHLVLDDGTEMALSDRVLHFRLNVPGLPPGSVYKLYITGHGPGEDVSHHYQGASGAGPTRDPDRVPPDLHNDPPPPEFRK